MLWKQDWGVFFCYVPPPLHHPSKPLTSLKKSDGIGDELSASLGKIREEEANPETEMRGWDAGIDCYEILPL